MDVENRADALAGNLHEPEFAQRQDVVTGSVVGHNLAHVVVKLLAVFVLGHVDEVDNNNAAHVAQTQLAGNLVGRSEVHFKSVAFLIASGLCAVA